jgi:hypothetical protein
VWLDTLIDYDEDRGCDAGCELREGGLGETTQGGRVRTKRRWLGGDGVRRSTTLDSGATMTKEVGEAWRRERGEHGMGERRDTEVGWATPMVSRVPVA